MAIEGFVRPYLRPRQVGEGRVVLDEGSDVVPLPTSAAQVGATGQKVNRPLFYGGGPTPGVGGFPFIESLYRRGVEEVPTRVFLNARSNGIVQMCEPKWSPLTIRASTPTTVPLYISRGGRGMDLPPIYYTHLLPSTLATFVSMAKEDAAIGRGTRVLMEAGAFTTPDYADFMKIIKFHMLEPPVFYDNPDVWQLWTKDEIIDNINRRVSKFCLETGITKEVRTIVYPLAYNLDGYFSYPLPIPDIRRVAYRVGSGPVTKLERMDEHSLAFGVDPNWQALSGAPLYYTIDNQAGKVRLVPKPVLTVSESVTLIFHYVFNPTPPTGGDTGGLAQIPTIFLHYIKWGVMADMLTKQGEANDPERAQYCEARFQEGIELAKAMIGRVE